MMVGLIGHGGLLRAFTVARPIRGSGHVQGSHPQPCPDGRRLGFRCARWTGGRKKLRPGLLIEFEYSIFYIYFSSVTDVRF